MDKPLVLLVDDNEATTTLLTALLQKDFDLDVCSDGVEAVEKLKTRNYSAVILDLLMPQLDGYGVLDFVVDHNPGLLSRTLVVSAAINRAGTARLRQYGVAGIILKPFDVDVLLAAVRKCAGSSMPRGPFLSSGVILLLAEMLRQPWR